MSDFFPADHPQPAPERELAEWAADLERGVTKMKPCSVRASMKLKAKLLRDMLASHQALRERCWEAEQKANQQSV